MIHFVVPAAHDRGIREYLAHWGRDVAPRMRVVHVESLPGTSGFSRGTYVLAGLDQLTPAMSAFVSAWHDALAGQDRVRFLNHPTRTRQRFALLDTMHRAGYNEFRAFHATGDLRTLRFPAFLRSERTHNGAISPLLHSPAAVETALGRAILQGSPARHLLVVEFCDTADPKGYYRKYSAFAVGDRILPRSLACSRQWMLKFHGSEFTRALAEEEQSYVRENPHDRALRDVFDLAGVSYGRIDYAMKDGRPQIWEINLNPTIGRGLRPSTGNAPRELDAIRTPTKEHFYRCFREAWEAADPGTTADDRVEVTIDPVVVRAALAAGAPDEPRWLSMARRLAGPARPVIAPLVAAAFPLVARMARRRARLGATGDR